jgi:hypothetical protein
VVDATGSFWAFWEKYAAQDAEARVAGFREMVMAARPELFLVNVIGRDPTRPQEIDERLPGYVASLDARIAVMRALSASVREGLSRFDASFRRTFPTMRWRGTVYFTLSVDAFDGAVRMVAGEPALLFGIDKIALIHGADANLGPLFHHELFHVHHEMQCPSPDYQKEGPHGLYDPLWREGLAVYVSRVLNPGANNKQLLLDDEMVRRGTEMLPALAKELQSLLDDAKEEQYRDFFLGAGQRQDIPKRVAYFVGLRVVEKVAADRALPDLVRLCGPELRAAIEEALKKLS